MGALLNFAALILRSAPALRTLPIVRPDKSRLVWKGKRIHQQRRGMLIDLESMRHEVLDESGNT